MAALGPPWVIPQRPLQPFCFGHSTYTKGFCTPWGMVQGVGLCASVYSTGSALHAEFDSCCGAWQVQPTHPTSITLSSTSPHGSAPYQHYKRCCYGWPSLLAWGLFYMRTSQAYMQDSAWQWPCALCWPLVGAVLIAG